MLQSQSGSDERGDQPSAQSTTNIAFLLILIFTIFLYFSFSDSGNKDEISNVIKIRPNLDDTDIFYHNKTYVHPSYTIPQVRFKLLNETTIDIESSDKPDANSDYVLSWKYKEDSTICFKPFKKKYGLISISVCKSKFTQIDPDRKFIYFGLLRADRKICQDNEASSWSCQKDYEDFNKSYDSTYCIIVVKSPKINDILHFTHDFLAEQKIPKTNASVGMFCGNPLLARSANTDKEVFFVNLNTTSEGEVSPFFICKFSSTVMDVNECFNTEVVSSTLNVPITMMHDPTTDVIMTANYNPDDKNLNLLTFNTSRLSFRAAFRSIPSPSGWLINLGRNSKGKVFFAGDAAPYEVLGIYDTLTSKEKYHNLYV